MRLHELLDEVIHVICHTLLIVVHAQAIRKAGASWLVDVQDIGLGIPRVRVANGASAICIDGARTILAKERHLR